jgi:hypothetical protein
MSRKYIENHFDDITNFANIIEKRIDDDFTAENLIRDNEIILDSVRQNNLNYILIDDKYEIKIDL